MAGLRASDLLAQQLGAHLIEPGANGVIDLGVAQIELFERGDDALGDERGTSEAFAGPRLH